MNVNHISILVRNIDEGINRFSKVFGTVSFQEEIFDHQVSVAIFELANTKIELISPHPNNLKLLKRLDEKGEGIHHLGLDELVLSMTSDLEFVSEETNGVQGKKVKFLHPKDYCGTLLEVVSN
jgi:methylmalonyl-CoA/ethylmalonyl-CoA epimerase